MVAKPKKKKAKLTIEEPAIEETDQKYQSEFEHLKSRLDDLFRTGRITAEIHQAQLQDLNDNFKKEGKGVSQKQAQDDLHAKEAEDRERESEANLNAITENDKEPTQQDDPTVSLHEGSRESTVTNISLSPNENLTESDASPTVSIKPTTILHRMIFMLEEKLNLILSKLNASTPPPINVIHEDQLQAVIEAALSMFNKDKQVLIHSYNALCEEFSKDVKACRDLLDGIHKVGLTMVDASITCIKKCLLVSRSLLKPPPRIVRQRLNAITKFLDSLVLKSPASTKFPRISLDLLVVQK
ncbi:hypothetical protein L1887_24153 [Cichorium endivia]|nr:hypothetical protein L1887_24153 [Cichorium endivia]